MAFDRSMADPRLSTRLQIAFTEQSSNHFPEILQQQNNIVHV